MATVEAVEGVSGRTSSPIQVLLHGVAWPMYVALRDVPENSHYRMTYDRGELEIMLPSRLHEQYAELIRVLIRMWTVELAVGATGCGSMTIRREHLEKGIEPDACYYVQNEPLVWNKKELDFSVDPPPDLAIEVDLSRSSRDKMALYEAIGVPELWRYDGDRLTVYVLGDDRRYLVRGASIAFPQLPMARVEEAIEQLHIVPETQILLSFRDWIRAEVIHAGDAGSRKGRRKKSSG